MPMPQNLTSYVAGAFACAVLAGHAPRAAAEPGIWQKHDYSFAFMGFTSAYSCDGLADKLRVLLLAAGARPDAKVRAGACAGGFGRPDKFARADLTFYTLLPAQGGAAPAGAVAAATAAVDGSWMPVSLTRLRPRELGRGDCELVEQFKSNVLPMFTTRRVENRTTCIPHQDSGSDIDLRFDSFGVPAPVKLKPQPPIAANSAAAAPRSAIG